ncbi:unnamed protein product [Peronospora destructor]|uniref:Uncharacterized protein n=1 Tax=Peronospora destructor TaxID=86335 RepID=A0AAV0SVE0_9STRA|nr:unnamed protein product [Peronospora destructor]
MPKAARQRLMASDSDVGLPEDFSDDDRLSSSFTMRKKHKKETSVPAKNTSRKQSEAVREAYEVELQLLAIETRRLDFEVAQWKHHQMLRREALQLKSEEIKTKEVTTKQQQQTHVMELKAGILQALDQAGQLPAQARTYLALLEG